MASKADPKTDFTPKPALREVVILLVDDDPEDAFLTRRTFAKGKLANDFHHVTSGEEMLAFLRDGGAPRPHLILLDINMPGMGGLGALRTLRRAPDLRTIPVVMLSTSEEREDVVASYDVGANSYISKPVDIAGMAAIVEQLEAYWFRLVRLPEGTD